jgi:rRNA maturation endonuclease Nob1
MRRNTTGLKKSARLRSEKAMERALAALHRMDASDRDINFRTVASEAKVSTAWLYGQEELRVRIMRSRRTTIHRVVPSASATRDRERLSKQNIVATLRLRISTLEEKNRELTELLERAFGVIAQS